MCAVVYTLGGTTFFRVGLYAVLLEDATVRIVVGKQRELGQ